MSNNEAREILLAIIKEHGKLTAQEINYKSKGKIPIIQVNGVVKKLIDEKLIKVEQVEKTKYFRLGDKEVPTVQKKKESEEEKEVGSKILKAKTGSRDLSTWKFNGQEYRKGRLALAIFTQYAKDKRPTMKAAQELFGDDIVPAYGFIRTVGEAKKLSRERQRFFLNDPIKLKDCEVCVSNQIGSFNITKVITIAKRDLKYIIK